MKTIPSLLSLASVTFLLMLAVPTAPSYATPPTGSYQVNQTAKQKLEFEKMTKGYQALMSFVTGSKNGVLTLNKFSRDNANLYKHYNGKTLAQALAMDKKYTKLTPLETTKLWVALQGKGKPAEKVGALIKAYGAGTMVGNGDYRMLCGRISDITP
jgi:hypothetical protein